MDFSRHATTIGVRVIGSNRGENAILTSLLISLLACTLLVPGALAQNKAFGEADVERIVAGEASGAVAPRLEPRPSFAQPEVIRSNSEWRERDAWQRPQDVMDELGVATGSVVADVGAGRGYFSFHLAERVGPAGRVFAVDIEERELQSLRHRAERYRYPQIEAVTGEPGDPRLPEGVLDAVLVVNTYHEFRDAEGMLAGMRRALKPGGRLVVIDRDTEPGQARADYHARHSVPESLVRLEAARHGFRLLRRPSGFTTDLGREWYFLVFEKVEAAQPSGGN